METNSIIIYMLNDTQEKTKTAVMHSILSRHMSITPETWYEHFRNINSEKNNTQILPYFRWHKYVDINQQWWQLIIYPLLKRIDFGTYQLTYDIELKNMLEETLYLNDMTIDNVKKYINDFDDYCHDFGNTYTNEQKDRVLSNIFKEMENLKTSFQEEVIDKLKLIFKI